MSHKTFKAYRRETGENGEPEEKAEAVSFTLEGEKRHVVEGEVKWLPHAEEFTCLPAAPAGVSSFFVRTGDPVEFIAGLLEAEDESRFRNLIHSKDFIVEATTVQDICNWLAEEMLGRPTRPSAG